ncbi:putative amid-like mitochondrial oxidoreductase [Phaeomoniella chlamydospora]|uniref:Putative amid-like mitochondrial oxidoreductase n=1 Tax=Phaeomoniella chlamydospora TaxID=158046 RepID=A0A0G2DYT2_PHACM|nr:putative amid-like mitochondrial oxidoreductase [Phaeomoniella chlamydospora]
MVGSGPKYDILIVGGSFAGLTAAHHLLKNVIPTLELAQRDYKITMLTNSSKFFHKISAPRSLTNPDMLKLDKTLLDIAPGFKQYGDSFQLVLGYAKSVDSFAGTVAYDGTEGNASGTLKYDSLIIATGASFDEPLWGVSEGYDKLQAAYKEMHSGLLSAKTILIAGGGPAGVETAGEIANRFPKSKDITFLSGSTRLLPKLHNSRAANSAQKKLEKMGVKVVHSVRAKSWSKNSDGTTTVQLDNGKTKTVDIFIPSTGNKINSSWVPSSWLTSEPKHAAIKTEPHTLRLDVPGVENVYVFGSAGSYSNGGIVDILMAYKALGESFKVDQIKSTGDSVKQKTVYNKFDNGDFQMVPIGPRDGVVVIKGFNLPSFLCVMVKSKDFMTGKVSDLVEGRSV